MPTRNLMLSMGHNYSNVDAAAVSEIYQSGSFLRLSIKLDNSLWNIFGNKEITLTQSNAFS